MCKFGLPRGALTILLLVLLVHFAPIYMGLTPALRATATGPYIALFSTIGVGVSYLLYPIFGMLADLVFSRYKLIASGCLIMCVGLTAVIIYTSIEAFTDVGFGNKNGLLAIGMILIAVVIGSLGMIQANILQFGMDQLTEASCDKLSKFVHWYYWVTKLSLLLVPLVPAATLVYFFFFHTKKTMTFSTHYIVVEIVVIATIMTIIGFIVVICSKRSISTARIDGNPLMNIFHILKYSWQHTCPQNRSAFTYWENDIPKRIDLGKHKYGGPFTNEEVEDVKTFFRMLFLLLSMFGVHLNDDTFSLSQQLELQKGCPSIYSVAIVVCPFLIPTVFLVMIIPIYQTRMVQQVLRCLRLTMLKRMWLGLACCGLQVFCELVIFRVNIRDWQAKSSDLFLHYWPPNQLPTMFQCYLQTSNQTHTKYTVDHSIFFYLSIPQFLAGIAILLASMTALEFICAQAPQTMQGLLIGIWYALCSIRYLIIGTLDHFTRENIQIWYIYQASKGSMILISLMLYTIAAWCYKKRERDEVVNVQQMIEEIHEKYMKLAEEDTNEMQGAISA